MPDVKEMTDEVEKLANELAPKVAPPRPKKVSARKLLARELAARHRIYSPSQWASRNEKRTNDAEKAVETVRRDAGGP